MQRLFTPLLPKVVVCPDFELDQQQHEPESGKPMLLIRLCKVKVTKELAALSGQDFGGMTVVVQSRMVEVKVQDKDLVDVEINNKPILPKRSKKGVLEKPQYKFIPTGIIDITIRPSLMLLDQDGISEKKIKEVLAAAINKGFHPMHAEMILEHYRNYLQKYDLLPVRSQIVNKP